MHINSRMALLRIVKTALAAVFILYGGLVEADAKKPTINKSIKGKSETLVDFAYPQTVAEQAEKQLKASLRKGDDLGALQGALQLTVARDLISHGNSPRQIALLDSLSKVLKEPYASVAALMEADLLTEIYNQDASIFNLRVAVEDIDDEDEDDEDEENPQLMSFDDFKKKVNDLATRAIADCRGAEGIPLSSLGQILEFNFGKESIYDINSGFTLYDFIVYKGLSLKEDFEIQAKRGEIPFFKKADEKEESYELTVMDKLIDSHKEPSNARSCAIYQKSRYMETGAQNFLWEEILTEKGAPTVIPLLWNFNQGYVSSKKDVVPSPKEYAAKIKELEAEYASSEKAYILKDILAQLTRPAVSLNFDSPALSGKDLTVDIESQNQPEFDILIYRQIPGKEIPTRGVTTKTLGDYMTLVQKHHVGFDETAPFDVNDSIRIKLDAPGIYYFFPSTNGQASGIFPDRNPLILSRLTVTDIEVIEEKNYLEGTTTIYVVNAQDSRPIKGAEIKLIYRDQNKKNVKTLQTDSKGSAILPKDFNGNYEVSYKGSTVEKYQYQIYRGPHDNRVKNMVFFTDLALYKPGDTVRFAGVATEHGEAEGNILADYKVNIEILDPNWKTVKSEVYTTDASGRIYGEFKLPEGANTGEWRLRTSDNKMSGYQPFNVVEYKAPTIFVELKEKETDNTDFAEFEGSVMTYSGMPLGNVEVDYEIEYYSWYPWISVPGDSYGNKTTTNEKGIFSITLPLTNLKDSDYRFGNFTMTATATSDAGETAQSEPVVFSTGAGARIEARLKPQYCIEGDSLSFDIKLVNALGFPVKSTINYQLTRQGEKTPFKSGQFESPTLRIPTENIESGVFDLTIELPGDSLSRQTNEVLLYRKGEKTPPKEMALWVPDRRVVTTPGKNTLITVGSSYDTQAILCETGDSRGNSTTQWIYPKGKNITIEAGVPDNNSRTFVKLITVRNHTVYQETVTVVPQWQTEELTIKTETFRNRLTPGDQEKWKFTINKGGLPQEASVLAVMSNRALDAIAPFDWQSNLFNPYYQQFVNLNGNSKYRTGRTFAADIKLQNVYRPWPLADWQTSNRGLYGYTERVYMAGNMKMMAQTSSRAAKAEAMDTMEAEAAYDDGAIAEAEAPMMAEGGVSEEKKESQDEIREIEMPLAFFKPDLSTDKEGNLSIDFTVPNFNTEWKLQLEAYTPDLQSAYATYTATASKKVMVSMVAPRFIRTGDDITLRATLFNNSDEPAEIGGRYELFNPLTGETIKEVEYAPEKVAASGNRVIELTYHCPSDITTIGIRAFATTDRASDGEQTVIPILPSSQPVIESTTFYLPTGVKEFTVQLPEFKKGDRLTLSYCDNPIWTVVTALPGLLDSKSAVVTNNAVDFYSNCVSFGLISNYPDLKNGLKEMFEGEESELLISNLLKDRELKTVILENTPWENRAIDETLRMFSLRDLLDDDEAMKAIDNSWGRLMKARNADGSFSWTPGMKPSLWTTRMVMHLLGMLQGAGYLSDARANYSSQIGTVVKSGLKYCDNEIELMIKKLKNPDNFSYLSITDYVLTRSYFPDIKMTTGYSVIHRKAIDAIEKSWKDMDIYGKANAAIILWRNGKPSTAMDILESLRQYAMTSREKGMWYDNLGSGIMGADKLQTTSTVLQAFYEITPGDPAVEQLRQWLLLQRQGQDWREGLFSLEVVNSLLTTGSRWTSDSDKPQIYLGGKLIETSPSQLTGSIKIDLDPTEASLKELTVKRDAPTPAWGGVISQYIGEMKDVKAASIPELKIKKDFRVITTDEDGSSARVTNDFKIGDLVRVTMTVSCDRDLDYVALTDERPACLEPVEQLSAYTSTDGIYYYRETRNSSTNLYISFLPKGEHIIYYDCYVSEEGEFASGIATLQSQYAPLLTAHSAGAIVKVIYKN